MENERLENVFKWYGENKESDPNMFELVEVLSQVSRSDDKNLELAAALTDLEIDRLFNNGIVNSEDDPLIKMVREIKDKVVSGEEIPYETEGFVKSLAGVTFYLKTKEAREGNKRTVYDNIDEYVNLFDMREDMINNGGEYTDNMRANFDFITVRFDTERTLPSRLSLASRANERAAVTGNDKIMEMVEEVKPYIYPEREQELIDYLKNNTMMPMSLALESIINLAIGMDFDKVVKKIEEADISGWGISTVMNTLLLFAKNGPEFWMYVVSNSGQEVSDENLDFVKNKQVENIELEEKAQLKNTEPTF